MGLKDSHPTSLHANIAHGCALSIFFAMRQIDSNHETYLPKYCVLQDFAIYIAGKSDCDAHIQMLVN